MRRVAPLVMAAWFGCSGGKTIDTKVVESPASAPIAAGHTASITTLALTDDGNAAISQDTVGGTRLWPTLDGSREPIVIKAARAEQLAIGRDGDGYVIAVRDEGGGVELLRIAANGSVRGRSQIGPEPAIDLVRASAVGVIALRADQTVEVIDSGGALLARHSPPPGSRIVGIASRRDRTLALVHGGGAIYGQWIDATGWGARTPALELDVPPKRIDVVLSPDGQRVGVPSTEHFATVIELATGKRKTLPLAGSPTKPTVRPTPAHEPPHPSFAALVPPVPGIEMLGFVDDDTLVVTARGGGAEWVSIAGKAITSPSFAPQDARAVGDGRLVSAVGNQLALATSGEVKYLGYTRQAGNEVKFVGGAAISRQGATEYAVIGSDLQVRRSLELNEDWQTMTDLAMLGDETVVVQHVAAAGVHGIAVVDLASRSTLQMLSAGVTRYGLNYDRASRLLEVTDRAATYLVTFDPALRRFTTWYRTAGEPAHAVYFVDPARTDGAIAYVVRAAPDKPGWFEVRAIRRDELVVGNAIAGTKVAEVAYMVTAIDRAGRIYTNEQSDVVAYERGKEVARFAEVTGMIAPNSDGSAVAVLGNKRVWLFERDGTLQWEIAAPLLVSIGWVDGELVANHSGELVQLHRRTGAIARRECGWGFGLSALPVHAVSEVESVCDAR